MNTFSVDWLDVRWCAVIKNAAKLKGGLTTSNDAKSWITDGGLTLLQSSSGASL